MPRIQTLTGEINMRKQSAKAYVFHSPRAGGVGNAEVFLDKASDNGPTREVINRIGRGDFCAAIPGCKPEIVGRFVKCSYDVPDGEVLKVFVSVRRGYGNRPLTGAVFLRMRAKAAHRVLRFKLLDHADAAYTHAEVEGTFDVLTVEEAKALGCKVKKQFASYHTASAAASVLTENVVVQEEVEAPVRLERKQVTDERGEVHTVVVAKRKRRGVRLD